MFNDKLPTNYRADMDGLRALAVLIVLLFHYDYQFMSGGFVGVDVFFVISGYLISSIILSELNSGRFSFINFFFRRIRRLLPAYIVVVMFVFLASLVMLVPDHLKTTALHVATSIYYTSNLALLGEVDYFSTAKIFQPLIHTWSLSVEGQFYVFWSITCLFLFKFPRIQWIIIAAIFTFSIVGAIIFSQSLSSFYFTPFRVYEFAFGAVVYLVAMRHRRPQPFLENFFLAFGLALILYASVVFDDKTPMPSYLALVPCAGAALIIYGGQGGARQRHTWQSLCRIRWQDQLSDIPDPLAALCFLFLWQLGRHRKYG